MPLGNLIPRREQKVANDPDTSIRSVLHIALERRNQQKSMETADISTPQHRNITHKTQSSGKTPETLPESSTGSGDLLRESSGSLNPSPYLKRDRNEINLSGRDMFDQDLIHDSDMFSTYECSSSDFSAKGKAAGIETPPSSLYSTPPGLIPADTPVSGSMENLMLAAVDENVGAAESLVTNSVTTSVDDSSLDSFRRQPVLYSAIGSLEDPSGSFTKWKSKTTKVTDFPSARFIPPAKAAKSSLSQKLAVTQDNVGSLSSAAGELSTSVRRETAGILKTSSKSKEGDEAKKPERKVKIAADQSKPKRKHKKKKAPKEMFRPSSDAYTPRMGKKEIKYKPAEMRTPVQQMATSLGTLQRPNFRDALRRVAMILHQHIVKIEQRFEKHMETKDGLFAKSMEAEFSEENFTTPTYKCSMVRVPMARLGMVYGLKKTKKDYSIPSESEIYEFGHQLFKSVQLSSECSIVCLIYVERLMETGKVPLLATTWRPIFMCGLLLASKVWQDLSSWNIEFASVYPQYPLESINRLEAKFLRMVKWDLYISSSAYAKYYFALRSLVEKPDFRQRYNRMVGGVDTVEAAEALKIEKRTSKVKEDAISQLSRSM